MPTPEGHVELAADEPASATSRRDCRSKICKRARERARSCELRRRAPCSSPAVSPRQSCAAREPRCDGRPYSEGCEGGEPHRLCRGDASYSIVCAARLFARRGGAEARDAEGTKPRAFRTDMPRTRGKRDQRCGSSASEAERRDHTRARRQHTVRAERTHFRIGSRKQLHTHQTEIDSHSSLRG